MHQSKCFFFFKFQLILSYIWRYHETQVVSDEGNKNIAELKVADNKIARTSTLKQRSLTNLLGKVYTEKVYSDNKSRAPI